MTCEVIDAPHGVADDSLRRCPVADSKEILMRTLVPSRFLKRVLWIDAAASLACGALMVFDAPLLEALLRLPSSLLLPAGAASLVYAAFLAWLATRPRAPAAARWAPGGLNVRWAADRRVMAFGGFFSPNLLGEVFIALQVIGTLLLAELEFVGLKRSAPMLAA